MNRPVLSMLVVGILALAAVLPAAEAAGKEDRERTEDDDRGRGQGRGRSGDAPRPVTPTPENAGPIASVGAFQAEPESRNVSGKHVSFTYNETGVEDFRAGDLVLFDLTVQGEDEGEDLPRTQLRREGAAVQLRAPAFTFKAHDNPGAVAKVETDGTATFAFPAGVTFTQLGRERVEFTIGDVSGTLKGHGLRVNGSSVTVDDEGLVTLHSARGHFDQHRPDIGRAIGKGEVGAEATIARSAEGDELVQDVVSYGNVTMTTLRAERGNLTVAIEGHGTEGRVLVLNVDGRLVGAQKREDLTILMDNLSIPQATDLADILNASDDGFLPEYYLVFDPQTESFQLIVSVPHYSVHILSVFAPVPLPPPSVVFGVVAGVAVLVPGGWLLFRRKRDA